MKSSWLRQRGLKILIIEAEYLVVRDIMILDLRKNFDKVTIESVAYQLFADRNAPMNIINWTKDIG